MIPAPEEKFSGYPVPTSNTVYTPNQFFDVVLPNSSRGTVRIVGYMLRKILGWCDDQGIPVQPQVQFTYTELIQKANVSRSMIKDALDEAITYNFIRCIREPQPSKLGQSAVTGLYELCWNESEEYIKDITNFKGFYSGNGNLTYIPNAFFDYTLREEILSVIKVIGAVIRYTIGFSTKYGTRRQEISLPISRFSRITGITSREVLYEAIEEAIEKNHIVRISKGTFAGDNMGENTASVYSIKWKEASNYGEKISLKTDPQKKFAKNKPARKTDEAIAPGLKANNLPLAIREAEQLNAIEVTEPQNLQILDTKRPVRKAEQPDRLEIRNNSGMKSEPRPVRKTNRERLEKRNSIEITLLNNTTKEQQQSSPPVVAVFESYKKLIEIGFEKAAAKELSENYPKEVIETQISYLELRSPTKNKLGLLRRSIEENWQAPPTHLSPTKSTDQKLINDINTQEKFQYEKYLHEQATLIFENNEKLKSSFLEHNQKTRDTLANTNFISDENTRNKVLSDFDQETAVLKRFADYLVKERVIPTFSSWQKLQNQEQVGKQVNE